MADSFYNDSLDVSHLPALFVNQTECPENSSLNASCLEVLEQDENIYIQPWFVQLVYIIMFGAIVVIAAGGNVIVIWIVLAHKRMRTVTNYFLLNLSASDCLISVFNVCFNFTYMLYADWPFGLMYCRISNFVATLTICASTFTLMAISIDRYMAIIHPMKPRMGAKATKLCIGVIWSSAAVISLPNLMYSEIVTFPYADGSVSRVCYLIWPDGQMGGRYDFIYNMCITILTYFLPVTALAITYTRVGMELWGSQAIGEETNKQLESIKSKKKIVKMMIMVVLIFAICWLPQNIYFLLTAYLESIRYYEHIQHIYLFIYWLAMSNSMYNPMIYCYMNARFRRGFKQVFRCCPFVRFKSHESLSRRKNIPYKYNYRFNGAKNKLYTRNGNLSVPNYDPDMMGSTCDSTAFTVYDSDEHAV